jgi:hypothetical protein
MAHQALAWFTIRRIIDVALDFHPLCVCIFIVERSRLCTAAREHFRLRIRDKCPTQYLNSKREHGALDCGRGVSSNAAGAPGLEGKPGSERAQPSRPGITAENEEAGLQAVPAPGFNSETVPSFKSILDLSSNQWVGSQQRPPCLNYQLDKRTNKPPIEKRNGVKCANTNTGAQKSRAHACAWSRITGAKHRTTIQRYRDLFASGGLSSATPLHGRCCLHTR